MDSFLLVGIIELSAVLKLIVTGIDCLFDDAYKSRCLNKGGEQGFDGKTKIFMIYFMSLPRDCVR